MSKININTATVDELIKGVGITNATAKKIISLRQKAGALTSLDKLVSSRIISRETLNKIGDKLYIKSSNVATREMSSAPDASSTTKATTFTKLAISVQFDTTPNSTTGVLPGLFIRIAYTADDGDARNAAAERFALNMAGVTGFEIEGLALLEPITATVENSQGYVVFDAHEVKVEETIKGIEGKAQVLIPWKDLGPALQRSEPTKIPSLIRSGRFVNLHDPAQRFDGYHLFVDLVDDEDKRKDITLLLQQAYDGTPQSGAVLVDTTDPATVQRLSTFNLTEGTVKFDGGFSVERIIGGSTSGWLWVLSGAATYAGFRAEPQPETPMQNLTIIVPGASEKGTEALTPAETGNCGCGCGGEGTRVPYDVGESQLLGRPDLFNDDPGSYCEPFTNPNRILGERRLFTVLRVGQPEIRSTSPNTFIPELEKAIAGIAGRKQKKSAGLELPGRSQWASRFLGSKSAYLSAVNMFKKPDKAQNRRPAVNGNNPIDWDGDSTKYQALSVAGGHILEWRIQWRSNGYSLGDIRHTLTLAPRQTKRILKMDWRRVERARRSETTLSSDEVDQSTLSSRDYSDAVASTLSEWSKGGSHSDTTGVAGGVGAAIGPVVIGGGAAHGSANSSSWQQGGRSASASEEQKLRDAIRQHGDSQRQLQSTVVVESQQAESMEGVSEIVRNPNYAHSLTIIYHEILRHMRVDTALGGVRECLFVPFAIAPLTFERIARWRDVFEKRLIKKELRWAFKYTEDYRNNWVGSDVPAGARAEQNLAYLSGSLFIKLGIERPRDEEATEQINEAVRAEGGSRTHVLEKFLVSTWMPYAPFMAISIAEAVNLVASVNPTERETYFQRQLAPGMASRWVDMLQFIVKKKNGALVTLEGADFTFASSYRYNGTARVDFTIPVSELASKGIRRVDIVSITVKPKPDAPSLPPGSVANLVYGTIKFETAHYRRDVQSDQGARDLVKPGTGVADQALLYFPLSSYEQRNIRDDVAQAFGDIEQHVNDNLHHYHKVIWWHLDRDELYTLLDGFAVSEQDGRSIASVVEREPIGILGNMLVFRVASGAFIGVDGHKDSESLLNYYRGEAPVAEPMRISLPTDGLYAQAIMDKCVACEEHEGSLDWVLKDPDPALADFPAGLFDSRRAEPQNLTPTPLPASIINLQNAPAAPDPTGLAAILNTVGQAGAFRDMAGLAGTQANAQAAMQSAASLATSFGTQAANLKLADMAAKQQATTDADKKLASIERAKDKGLIDDAEASRQTAKVLENMHTPDASDKPQQDAAVSQAIRSAGTIPGSSIESRTAEGEVKVNLGAPVAAPSEATIALEESPPPEPHEPVDVDTFARKVVEAIDKNSGGN